MPAPTDPFPMLSLIWPLLIAAGIAGWGAAVAGLVRGRTSIDRTHPAEVLMVGIAVVVAATGLLAAAGLGRASVAVVLAGVLAGALPVRAWYLAHRDEVGTIRFLLIGAAVVAVLLVLTTSLAAHVDTHLWDDPNYLYLADRFRLQGNLTDPGNLRRIQSMGALTALQGVFLSGQPAVLLRMADLWLGGLLVMLLCGWRSPRQWSGPGLAFGAAVCLLYPLLLGMGYNSSPVLIPVGGFAVLVGQAVRVRVGLGDAAGRAVASAALGATGMALCAMRAYLLVPVALVVVVAAVGARRADGRRSPAVAVAVALWSALGAAVVGVGWAVAGIRDAATPLYPLLAGNIDTAFPQSGVQVIPITIGTWSARVAGGLLLPPWLGLVALGCWRLSRSRPRREADARSPDAPRDSDGWLGPLAAVRAAAVPTFALTGAVLSAWVGLFTVLFWNFGEPYQLVLTRYYQPLLFGLLVAVIALLCRFGLLDREEGRFERAVVLCVAVVLLVFAVGVPERATSLAEDLAAGRLFTADMPDPYRPVTADYDAVRATLPTGAHVFSATDLPHLLLDSRYSLETLDLAGFASRTPHLPYFTGDQAKLDWLRAQGFDRLVAMKPGTSWSMYQATKYLPSPTDPDVAGWDSSWAPYRDDWSDFIERLPALAPGKVAEHGRLLVVDLT